MKKRVLILASDQFGYLTDTFMYCKYARIHFEICYVGWDYGRPRIEMTGVQIQYISRQGSLIDRNIRLLTAFHQQARKEASIIFAVYVRGISIIKLLNPAARFVLDIRTLAVDRRLLNRIIFNLVLRFESLFFTNITIISQGAGRRLGLKKFHLLPLGGESFCSTTKSFNNLHLIYVGTLDNRKIIDCVKGFQRFLMENQSVSKECHFTIIGDSSGRELTEIRQYVTQNGLEKKISLTGKVPISQLSSYFRQVNIGVSYIPITPYYDHQTPTKTLEYLLSGLPVIATATVENCKLINARSGILIKDNPADFCHALTQIAKLDRFDSEEIRDFYKNYHWKVIVEKYFVRYMQLF